MQKHLSYDQLLLKRVRQMLLYQPPKNGHFVGVMDAKLRKVQDMQDFADNFDVALA